METSEYDFHYEPYRRVPRNSATTQKELTDYNSGGTLSTYNIWRRPIKRTMTTTYIDGKAMLGHYERPYSVKDSFPKGKGRRKPIIPSDKKMDSRDAYMSLLPTDKSIIRSERTRSPLTMATATQSSNLPEVQHKSANVRNKRFLSATALDVENSEAKFYGRCATTHASGAWIRRYKSMNESQTLSNLLRDQFYREKILVKKRSNQQLIAFSSSSSSSFTCSLIKCKREKC